MKSKPNNVLFVNESEHRDMNSCKVERCSVAILSQKNHRYISNIINM